MPLLEKKGFVQFTKIRNLGNQVRPKTR